MDISLNTFKGIRILVIGDVMLDCYICGDVSRISPEAPVPVLSVTEKTTSLGGAANVAANLAGLGCSVALWGVTGKDGNADAVSSLLGRTGVESFLRTEGSRPTTTKTRVVSLGRQIVRFDEETAKPVDPELEDELFQTLEGHVAGADAVILSDYGKGVLAGALAPRVIGCAQKSGKPVFVDPKGADWERYRGASCVTPNEKEIFEVFSPGRERGLSLHGEAVRRKYSFGKLLVTRGARGMILFGGDGEYSVPAPKPREVFDVSGAGDTAVSVLAAAIAAGMPWPEAVFLANTAAGVVITRAGTSPIAAGELVAASKKYRGSKICTREEGGALAKLWRERGERVVFTNGCFDLLHPGHIQLLRSAASEGDRLIVGLNSDGSVKRLKGTGRPVLNQEDRASILSALDCVDMVIIFSEDTPLELLKALQPDVLVKGGDYVPETVVGRDLVESRRGRVVIVPLLEGKSTTSILRSLKGKGQGDAVIETD